LAFIEHFRDAIELGVAGGLGAAGDPINEFSKAPVSS
jgi:hypothetical protein